MASAALRWPGGQYDVGSLRGSEDAIAGLLYSGTASPDLMVELLLPLLWTLRMHGHAANRCVDACMILHYAYKQFGIVAQPRPVDLIVSDNRTGKKIFYGRPDPHWADDRFWGHCVLWLPGSLRFMDPTVEQYPEIRRYRLGPICGRMTVSQGGGFAGQAALAPGELPAGAHIGVQREQALLLYTAVDERFADVVTGSSQIQAQTEQLHRAGINLAAWALHLLRLPEVADRVRQAPYPRLHALLDRVGIRDPKVEDVNVDDAGEWRFTVPGPDGTEVNLRLDQIPLPPAALFPTDAPANVDHAHIEAILKDVVTEARAVTTASEAMGGGTLPAMVFELPQAVAMRLADGRTVEAQTEGIIRAGFCRFTPAAAQPPQLPGWSLRHTAGGVELWDEGGIWARASLKIHDTWLAAATENGEILVLYGPHTGVRLPVGHPPRRYTSAARDAKLLNSRHAGVVAAARIPWKQVHQPG